MGLISVRVEYPWVSKVCSICKASDYYSRDCKRGQKVWVPIGNVGAKKLVGDASAN